MAQVDGSGTASVTVNSERLVEPASVLARALPEGFNRDALNK
jgi:hypothetical protein